MSMGQRIVLVDDHLENLRRCGGYYACPKGPDGKRLGPLVGYAGTYDGPDGQKMQFVGDVYANFAKAEVYPKVLSFIARCLRTELLNVTGSAGVDVVCGAPIGGYSLADALGLNCGFMMVKAERKLTAGAALGQREKSELVFARHSIGSGQRVVIVEDVCNNFSTTDALIRLIVEAGGDVLAIACFLNRSLSVDAVYTSVVAKRVIPVVSLVRQPINEWRQDDPAVVDDIALGNVVWKPKDKWSVLMQAMEAAAKVG